jgi:hypothetical protein
MSQDTIDDVITEVAVLILAYFAAQLAFNAYRSSKRRRIAKRTLRKTVTVLKATTKPVKVIKTKVR